MKYKYCYFIMRIVIVPDRFGSLISCMIKMMFAVKIVNNKVVDNLIICLVLKFQDHRSNGLGVTAI